MPISLYTKMLKDASWAPVRFWRYTRSEDIISATLIVLHVTFRLNFAVWLLDYTHEASLQRRFLSKRVSFRDEERMIVAYTCIHASTRPNSITLSRSQTWFQTCRKQVRAILTCGDSSNLVADRLAAGFRPAFDRPATRTRRFATRSATWFATG